MLKKAVHWKLLKASLLQNVFLKSLNIILGKLAAACTTNKIVFLKPWVGIDQIDPHHCIAWRCSYHRVKYIAIKCFQKLFSAFHWLEYLASLQLNQFRSWILQHNCQSQISQITAFYFQQDLFHTHFKTGIVPLNTKLKNILRKVQPFLIRFVEKFKNDQAGHGSWVV